MRRAAAIAALVSVFCLFSSAPAVAPKEPLPSTLTGKVVAIADGDTIAILASLFWEHGPPLVLKSDNGSAFIARDTGDLLAAWGILHLRNPRATPQYNGSCEAAGGSHKKITNDQAALAAHPGRWTSEDLHRAGMIRNRLGRPWGHRGPTPEDVWQTRQPSGAS